MAEKRPSSFDKATSIASIATRPFPNERSLAKGLVWTVTGRLAVVSLLFAGLLLLVARKNGEAFYQFTPLFLSSTAALVYAASLTQLLMIRKKRVESADRGHSFVRLAYSQIAVDIAWISALVCVSGGVESAFTFLYGAAVLLAALLLGPAASYLSAAVAMGVLLLVTFFFESELVPPPPDQSPEIYALDAKRIAIALLRNAIGLGLVALLAGHLALRLRRTGGQLRAAEKSAADLGKINEDIVRSLTAGLMTTSPSGVIRSANPAATDILRCDQHQLIGQPIGSLFPSGAPNGAHRTTQTAMRREIQLRRADGTEFPAGYTESPLLDAQGIHQGGLIIFQDLTEISELRQAAERAERMAVLGNLAAGLAHEIRNPLSSIAGSVDLVRENATLPQEDQQLLGIVSSEVERLNSLVTTMLDVARPRTPTLVRFDLRQCAHTVAQMARVDSANSSGVRVVVTEPQTDTQALVDPDQMTQVLWNLVKNAVQASAPESEVHVRLESTVEGTTIEVSDKGKGIDAEQRKKLFDAFYSGRTHGVGLGLALVKQIVDAHEGSIDVESTPGQGATFRIRLQG